MKDDKVTGDGKGQHGSRQRVSSKDKSGGGSRSQEDRAGNEGLQHIEMTSPESPGFADGEPYPEGGLRAWLVVLGAWCALFSSLGLLNSLATFQAYVATHQLSGQSEGKIGWIFSVHTFLAFFCGVYIGPIFDKYGPRWLVLMGTVVLGAGIIFLSFSSKYWHFLLSFGVLCGLAASLLFTPSIASIGHFFKAKRGIATGIASTGGGIAGVVIPSMMKALFDRVGWAWAIRILALMCVTLCAATNFLIRSRLPPLENASSHPDVRIFKNTAFLLTTMGIFMIEFGIFVPYTYISSYMLFQGFDENFSFNILSILNAGSVFGRALPGYWADKIGPFNSNIIAALLSVVACLAIWLPAGHTTAGIVVFALLIGFASGANITTSPVCVGKLCKTQEYGRYYATTYTVVSVACLVSIPIAGEIVEANGGSYWGLIVFNGCVYVGGFVLLIAAKVACVGWKPFAVF